MDYKYFTRAEFDLLEGRIDEDIENSTRTPISYHGNLYYLHFVDADRIHLVDINEYYVQNEDPLNPGHFNFVAQTVTVILSSDTIISYILNVVNAIQSVDVVFEQFFTTKAKERMMKIQLKQSVQPSNIRKFYTFVEDHYELEN